MFLSRIKKMTLSAAWGKAMIKSLRSTFSQYGEDMLFRLLLHPGTSGTYIDVGAHDPAVGSNTCYLYNRGWRGITIDPNPIFQERYRKLRPKGVHLVEGVAGSAETLTYFVFEDSRLNTFDKRRAAQLQKWGNALLSRKPIPCSPLDEIVSRHLGTRQIDLLNVDCEGLDAEVIHSLNLSANRPTVIIIEDYEQFAALRDGTHPSGLHDLLTTAEYRPIAQAAFASLYVAREWRDLMKRSQAYDPALIQHGILP